MLHLYFTNCYLVKTPMQHRKHSSVSICSHFGWVWDTFRIKSKYRAGTISIYASDSPPPLKPWSPLKSASKIIHNTLQCNQQQPPVYITTVTGDIIVTLDVHGGIFCLLTERTGFSRSSQSSKINFQGTNISDKPLQVYTDISETGDVRRPIQAVDVRQPNLSSSCSSQVSWNFINLCMPPNWLLLMWYTNLFFEFTRNKCPWWHSFDVTTWAFLF